MSLNRDEIILDQRLRREFRTSLYEICSITGVPIRESEFDVDTQFVTSEYDRIVDEAVQKLDEDMDAVTDSFRASSFGRLRVLIVQYSPTGFCLGGVNECFGNRSRD